VKKRRASKSTPLADGAYRQGVGNDSKVWREREKGRFAKSLGCRVTKKQREAEGEGFHGGNKIQVAKLLTWNVKKALAKKVVKEKNLTKSNI